MGSLTNFAENALINHVFTSAYTPSPTSVFLVLCTADPGEAAVGNGCEEHPNSDGYTRKTLSLGSSTSGGSGRRVTQDAIVSFEQASGTWTTISHWAIAGTATHGTGEILAYGAFNAGFRPVSGNTPSVASGSVYVEKYNATPSTCGFTNAGMDELLDLMFNSTSQAINAAGVYLTLGKSVMSASKTTVGEESGGNYSRYDATGAVWTTATGGSVSNNTLFTFANPSASWGTVVSVVVFSADGTAGTAWMYDNETVTDQQILEPDTASIVSGGFKATITT